MTNLLRTRIFLLGILLGSGLGAKAQTWDWKHTFPVSYQTQLLPDTTIIDHKEIEVMDIAPASNGKLYSCGLFWGKKAEFDNLTVWADTLLPKKIMADILLNGYPQIVDFQTSFIACQNANGQYEWVKTLTGSNNWNSGGFHGWDRTGFYKLCLAPDGSIFVTGNSRGDSVNFNGTSLKDQSPNQPYHYLGNFILLKLDPEGNRIWHRIFPYEIFSPNQELSTHAAVFPRYLQCSENGPELLLNGHARILFAGDSTTWSGPLYVSFSNEGQVLQIQKETGIGFPYSHQNHTLTRRLKDKRWVIGYNGSGHFNYSHGKSPGFTGIEVYNANFSQKQFRISYQTRGTTGVPFTAVDTGDLFLQQVWELPDGNLGLVLGSFAKSMHEFNSPYSELSLIVNADTLDILPFFQPGNTTSSLFIKLNQEGCIKQIEPLNYLMVGNGQFTENGHLITCRQDTMPFSNRHRGKLVGLSKNGTEVFSASLGEGVFWPIHHVDDYIPAIKVPGVNSLGSKAHTFQIRTAPTGNKAWICAGNFVGQFTYPDPVLGDESAPGCLRGNAITVTREIQKQGLFLSQSQSGVEIRATDNQAGRYRILSSDGRLLEEGSWKGSQTPIGRSIGAKGIYQVMLSGSGNPKTLRFVQF